MTTVKYSVLLIFSFAIFAWIGFAQAQQAKTVKLPSGDEVVDISGEWDAQIENYGPWSSYGNYPQVIKITLEGNSFIGVRMISDPWHSSPGSEIFQGELDKDGIKKLQLITRMGPMDAKGQISEDGNKIMIDDGEKARSTLIRK